MSLLQPKDFMDRAGQWIVITLAACWFGAMAFGVVILLIMIGGRIWRAL